MTFISGLILKVTIFIVAIGGLFILRRAKKIKDDSFMEEVVEQVIKDKAGIDIDLSPDSPEVQDPVKGIKEASDLLEKQIDRI